MKKFLATTLASLVLAAATTATAQTAASHDVVIDIPQVLLLQIVDTSGEVVTSPVVRFDIDLADYLDVAEAASATEFTPTSSNFADVRVMTNRAGWSVTLTAGALNFNSPTSASAAGLSLGDITVVDGAVQLFALDTAAAIGSGTNATSGWESLGFGGDSFRLSLDGDEEPGTYTWTITYTISAP